MTNDGDAEAKPGTEKGRENDEDQKEAEGEVRYQQGATGTDRSEKATG